MRMQLQTLQMQAMSLGVGGGLPGALPGSSAPMMVRAAEHRSALDGASSGASTVQMVVCLLRKQQEREVLTARMCT